jgi:hypothetical protein
MKTKKAPPSDNGNTNRIRANIDKRIFKCKSPALKLLSEIATNAVASKYPTIPREYIVVRKFDDRTARGMTKVITYIRLMGGQAERTSSTGRRIEGTKTFIDVSGFTRQVGNVTWIPGTGTRGSSDISATIKNMDRIGISVKIEVKIRSDRMSTTQRDYHPAIERASGIYYIARVTSVPSIRGTNKCLNNERMDKIT